MKKTKLNVKLLRKIQKHILEEPLRLDMMNFVQEDILTAFRPPCGTTGCIAGWGLILSGSKPKNIAKMAMIKIASKAAKLLGVSYIPPDAVKDIYGIAAHWAEDSAEPRGEAIRLFLVKRWPSKFANQYNDLHFVAISGKARQIKTKLAKITSDRIDHFIKTGE